MLFPIDNIRDLSMHSSIYIVAG